MKLLISIPPLVGLLQPHHLPLLLLRIKRLQKPFFNWVLSVTQINHLRVRPLLILILNIRKHLRLILHFIHELLVFAILI